MFRRPGLILAACLFLAALPMHLEAVEWPNGNSRANSDEWLLDNHSKITRLRPKLLVLNFTNGLDDTRIKERVDRLIAALQESSRYHGYRTTTSPAFLEYEIHKIVNLADPDVEESNFCDGNSTKYPRLENVTSGFNFDYGALFTRQFADHYAIAGAEGEIMLLKDLVGQGIIHEVWMLALHRTCCPYECTEVKQAYNASLEKKPGEWKQAGNGGSDRQPFIERSLRILFINSERGPGCAMESLGHALEGTATSGAVPYFSRYFREFAGFDLDKKYSAPFTSLYGARGKVEYPTSTSLRFNWQGNPRTIENYVPVGGNVHFTPNGRDDYDMSNRDIVLSGIENYRLQNGTDGKDLTAPWSNDKFERYKEIANDCMGPWLVYWRQSMPGLDNLCFDDDGKPMLNWWPFLFY